ncbi:hypothetical protein [Rhizobium sp. AC44/96]|uniref:hypothetical protein n=1 Tax=Rhizobium sp. AC44/96 TaxID=1841654 RepID=UPI001147117C|nr:hypothetical protein [Rhizobium sp. AC44/96]
MPLVAIPGKIKPIGGDRIIVMDAGANHQAVHITEDALLHDCQPAPGVGPTPGELSLFEQVASHKFDNGELAFDGNVWITASDIAEWQRERAH